jgi:hypothetical protein
MTTHIAHVAEQFTMNLEESLPGDEPWYIDWAIKNPGKISKSVTVGWYAYQSLLSVYEPEEIKTVWEPFGGIGAQSLMIRGLFPTLDWHWVGEYTPQAVKHLRRVLPQRTPKDRNGVIVEEADAYNTTPHLPCDLVALDFGDFTCWKTREGQQHRLMLDWVFDDPRRARLMGREDPDTKAVVLTDVAGPRLGLHRSRYEALLGTGTCADYPSYLSALADLLEEMYDYTMIAGFYHHGAAKMAFVPKAVGDRGIFVPAPPSPVGLEIL